MQDIGLDHIMRATDPSKRKTKIICTLGPACWSVEGLGALIDAGMNIARFNFSHGDHEAHAGVLARLREAMSTRPGKPVAVMLDTKGPEIRTGFFDASHNGKLNLTRGQDLELVTDYSFKTEAGKADKLAVTYASMPSSVEVGCQILVADGSLVLKVKELKSESVICEVLNNCVLGERKNCNLPGVVVDLPTLTEKDIDDLVNWGLVQGIDFIAASFVRKGSDIDKIREVLGPPGRGIKIIAKIENQEGLDNFDEILAKTDSVMVARGDLGMEIPPEKVFLAQKMMIHKCNIAGKPVVTATQMFESMITNPRPTRAECTDVANAVLDGTDCVMLSGETANGGYPCDAVRIMGLTACEAEGVLDYNKVFLAIRENTLAANGPMDTTEAVASSAVKTAMDIDAKMIVVLTETGTTARRVAKYRPEMPMLVLTGAAEVARQVKGYMRGAECIAVGSMIGTTSVIARAIDAGKEFGFVKTGDNVVVIHGQNEATAGATNLLKVLTVE